MHSTNESYGKDYCSGDNVKVVMTVVIMLLASQTMMIMTIHNVIRIIKAIFFRMKLMMCSGVDDSKQ